MMTTEERDLDLAVVRVPFIIDLPHEGFNPSIARWRGRLLMAWRRGCFTGRLWLGELTEEHRLRWARELDFSRLWRLTEDDWLEDPRLIVAGDRVLVAFSYVRLPGIVMALATLDEALEVADCRICDAANHRWEKNWQFFEHDRVLHGIYASNPHTVGWRVGEEFRVPAADGARLPWAWGEVRGGTPPVRVGGEYFSFFHSSQQGRYVVGFYGFEARPPFRVTRWPSSPCLVAARSALRPDHRVVFPGGAVLERGRWLVAYGWHDAFCCLGWFDHEELLATLTVRALAPAAPRFSGRQRWHTAFMMTRPPAPEPVREPVPTAPPVKLVTALVDLHRHDPRQPDDFAASCLTHVARLFAAEQPLVIWLDCEETVAVRIREAAAGFPCITVKSFCVRETETWQVLSGPVATPAARPCREHDPAARSMVRLALGLLRTELIARSLHEGDIPAGMECGWMECGSGAVSGAAWPGVPPPEPGALRERLRSIPLRAPAAGLGPDGGESVARPGCSGILLGPPLLLVQCAGAVLHTLRSMLAEGRVPREADVWALLHARCPEWFTASADESAECGLTESPEVRPRA